MTYQSSADEEVDFLPDYVSTIVPAKPFFKLLPRDLGRSTAESLQSYVRRLADAHCISPYVLSAFALSSTASPGAVPDILARLRTPSMGSGASNTASMLSEAFADRTGEPSVLLTTLAPLSEVISNHGLHRKRPAHCPVCVSVSLTDAHEQLLWTILAVAACPVHKVCLVDSVCGSPGTDKLHETRKLVLPGVCNRCGSIGFKCKPSKPANASAHQVWIADQVGSLISLISGGFEPNKTLLSAGLTRTANLLGKGNLSRGALAAGLRKGQFSDWRNGKVRPPLAALIALASSANVSLKSIFEGEAQPNEADSIGSILYAPRIRRVRQSQRSVERLIRIAVSAEAPPSVAEVARSVMMDRKTLQQRYPRQVAQIQKNYLDRLAADKLERRRLAHEEVSKAMTLISSRNERITLRRVREIVRRPFMHRGIYYDAYMTLRRQVDSNLG
ncbi:TniQ family protein [Schauerella aestuarii]|uniref:TniQ family protein n=1 Tax=Schauerella aestuarii TaxID=2511204 RepID=UPI00136EAA37|nr:hypothetical protein [Achromobacter aestuarii]